MNVYEQEQAETGLNLIQHIESLFVANDCFLRITYKNDSELLPLSMPIVSKLILIRELKFMFRNYKKYQSIEISNDRGELVFRLSHNAK
ncbi:hypothetical protein V4D09_02500 [Vibrio mimicus]|uniref:hypothetical protein n=1 Tax=Vibrio mimicus TaxID=674 RepID=UPI002F92F1E7